MLMRTRKITGFTLIEIMITVAIIGVIAAIALPNYQDSVRKSRRQVAISDMLLYKQAQEKYRTNNLTYGTLAQISVAPYAISRSSKTTDYTFDIINPTATTYTVTASALGAQNTGLEASTCAILTLDQADNRLPVGCWAK